MSSVSSSSSVPSPRSNENDSYLHESGSSSSASFRGTFELPPTMRHKEGRFRNARGQRLSYIALFPNQKSSKAPPQRLRGVFVFLHGIFEHSRRFFHLYERLCENGFCVLAYDLLSHGQSDCCEHKRRGHARRFRYFVDDTNDFITFAKRSVLPEMLQDHHHNHQLQPEHLPMIMSGASFGSLVGIHTVLSCKHTFAAMALAPPTISLEWTPTLRLQSLLAAPVSAIAPKFPLASATRYEHLCRDQAFVQDLINDPLVTKGNLTARMAKETLKACAALQDEPRIVGDANSSFCTMPVLFMMGSADQLTSVPQAVEYFERMKSRDKEFKVFPGLFHVLYDDPEKDEVFRHLISWLQKRFPEPVPEVTDWSGGSSSSFGGSNSARVRIYNP